MSILSEYKNSERQRGQLNLQYITLLERKSSETGKIIDTLPARRCIRRNNVTKTMGEYGELMTMPNEQEIEGHQAMLDICF